MARSRLICNIGLADFFTLPDDGDVWRKKGNEPVYVVDASGDYVKRYKMYECESLYDSSKQIKLPANTRVNLIDK